MRLITEFFASVPWFLPGIVVWAPAALVLTPSLARALHSSRPVVFVMLVSFGGIILPVLVWFVLPTSEWPWWERIYLVIIANTVVWIAVTLLTPADEPAILRRFYRAARPLGVWGPIREHVAPQE